MVSGMDGRRGPGEETNPFDDLNVEVLFEDQLVVAAGAQSRWAHRRKVDIADLADEPWILSGPNRWNYRVVAEAFRMRGASMPKVCLKTLSVHLRSNLLTGGEFITTFPNSVVDFYARRFGLKVLPVDLPRHPWPVVVLTVKHWTLSPCCHRLHRLRPSRHQTAPQSQYGLTTISLSATSALGKKRTVGVIRSPRRPARVGWAEWRDRGPWPS